MSYAMCFNSIIRIETTIDLGNNVKFDVFLIHYGGWCGKEKINYNDYALSKINPYFESWLEKNDVVSIDEHVLDLIKYYPQIIVEISKLESDFYDRTALQDLGLYKQAAAKFREMKLHETNL